jgi:hypothetical protein
MHSQEERHDWDRVCGGDSGRYYGGQWCVVRGGMVVGYTGRGESAYCFYLPAASCPSHQWPQYAGRLKFYSTLLMIILVNDGTACSCCYV